jgi:GT2 family glycosyltransferase
VRAAPDLADADSQPLVVSIVVNYHGLEQTLVCVESLLAVDYPRHSIVVVDNASGPVEVDALRARLARSVEIIGAERNLGYGGGANLGLEWARRADAAYAWVLNNDTEVDSRSVHELVRVMEREPRYGILTPQIEAPIGPESPLGVWFAGGTANLERGMTRQQVVPRASSAEVEPTGYVTGCAMFIRLHALAATGLFWEPLFLYWEDVDLSLRMRRGGWLLGVVPAARVFHFVHGSTPSKTYRYYSSRNAILVAKRHLRGTGAARAAFWVAARALRSCARSLVRRDGPLPIADVRGLAAGVATAIGLSALPVVARSPHTGHPKQSPSKRQ